MELNRLGDSSLRSYSVENYSGDTLRKLYNVMDNSCLADKKCDVQLIKTPVSKDNKMVFEIYHSNVSSLQKVESTSSNKVFNYYDLTEEEFIDHDGTFSTNLSEDLLRKIAKDAGVSLKTNDAMIDYNQIFQYNSINFVILFVLSQLILFIYTFTRIKINAVKKVLGFSTFRMVTSALRQLILMQIFIIPVILIIHFVYFLNLGNLIPRYFYVLFIFLLGIGILNLIMLLITQFSLKYIDINLMIKNKIYSNRLNMSLYAVKILLILSITVAASIFSQNLVEYKEALNNYDKFTKLGDYYTSIGYNSDEYEKALRDKDLLVKYGNSVKEIVQHYSNSAQLYVHDVSSILPRLSPSLLERQGITIEDVLSDFKKNYLILNKRFLKDFTTIKDSHGRNINFDNIDQPTILVPEKQKQHEKQIIEFYVQRYNSLSNYNVNYGLESSKVDLIKSINVIYISDGFKPELLGKSYKGELSGEEIKDPIILVDQGKFDNLYYFDQLNQGNIIIKAENRKDFSAQIHQNGLSKLIIEGSLITPFQTQIRSTEFLMQQSLIFVVLFIITLIFVIYISNYIDIMSNRKNLAIRYVLGYSDIRIMKSRLLITLILLSAILLSLFIPFNILIYILILIIDIAVLFILYTFVIVRNIQDVTRGGS
ncbi:hypothetical protein [Paenibacillus sp. JGP012]|uniref:hypothetical protein n=1 Tax=Paenibacillus sp. JGP012 TaxID=2735914 RepID=UPI0016074F8C|nr:hypothetical protein [Paenibacillus sp. JGP012]